MTKAPERIWAFLDGPFVGMFVSGGIKDGGTEYLRADHALALVAAENEACAAVAKEIADQFVGYMSRIERAIRARTPDDATAALERVKQEARNEALREAAEAAGVKDRRGKPVSGPHHAGIRDGRNEAKRLILALIREGQSDGE